MMLIALCVFFISIFIGGGRVSYQHPMADSRPLLVTLMADAHKSEVEGDFQAAITLYEKALALVRSRSEPAEELRALLCLGLLNWNIGQLEVSADYYKQAVEVGRLSKNELAVQKARAALEINNLYSTGKNSRIPGKYQQSIEAFERAIAWAKSISSDAHQLKCLRQLSATYWEMNDLENFLKLNEEALAIARRNIHRREEGICLNNIGLYYWKKNEYSKALRYLQKALDIADQYLLSENKADILVNISLVLSELGLYDRALNYLQKSTEIDIFLHNDSFQSINLNNEGNVYRNKWINSRNNKYYEDAISCFKRALILATKSNDLKIETIVLNNLAETYFIFENFPLSIKYLKEALIKSININNFELISSINTNLGNVFLNTSNTIQAEKQFLTAINIAKDSNNLRILWEAYFGLGQCYEKNGKFEGALANYDKSIGIIEKIRGQIYLDTFKSGYARDKAKVYERLIDLLLNLKARNSAIDEKIYENVEKAKARAFLDSLEESKVDIQAGMSKAQRNEIEKASNSIASLSLEISAGGLSNKKRNELSEKLSNEEDRYMMLISKMRAESPELANLIAPDPAALSNVCDSLDEQTGLIEYFLGEKRSVLLCITKGGVHIFELPSRSEIEDSIIGWIKYLSAPSKVLDDARSVGERIYREILFPLSSSEYDKLEKLVFIPDGILYYLPFETLAKKRSDKNCQYLVEKYRISYAPSASAFIFLKRNTSLLSSKMRGLLALGDPLAFSNKRLIKSVEPDKKIFYEIYEDSGFTSGPLPFSRREIIDAAKYFPARLREIYLGEQAREEVIKNKSFKSYQVIHFACHGFIDDTRPIRSALILSPGDGSDEDGYLQVRELYNLRLAANLVILSACQTGKGTLEKGEGLLGLPRIFFHTGAASVVSSLWTVSDQSTAFFMKTFYEKLALGYSKAEALAVTKREMLRTPNDHPYYWAAFILCGEPDSSVRFN